MDEGLLILQMRLQWKIIVEISTGVRKPEMRGKSEWTRTNQSVNTGRFGRRNRSYSSTAKSKGTKNRSEEFVLGEPSICLVI